MRLVMREQWSESDARRAAELTLDPKTNGGWEVGPLVGAEELAPILAASDQPMWLVEDEGRAAVLSGQDAGPGRKFLHFAACGYTAAEVGALLRAFISAVGGEWLAVGPRTVARLVAVRHLGAVEIARTADACLLHVPVNSEASSRVEP